MLGITQSETQLNIQSTKLPSLEVHVLVKVHQWRIKSVFTAKGYRVLCVPEIPTMVVYAGGMILMSKFNSQERVRFQALLIRFQMYAEDYFTKLAEMSHQPAIVLCDRGTVDPYAYIPKE